MKGTERAAAAVRLAGFQASLGCKSGNVDMYKLCIGHKADRSSFVLKRRSKQKIRAGCIKIIFRCMKRRRVLNFR
jgi:hypothetical protein